MSGFGVNELRAQYHQGRLVPFVGAGVSMAVEWEEHGTKRRGPSWNQLVDEAARQLGFADPDLLKVRGQHLQILEYFRLKNDGQLARLTNWLYASMRPPDEALLKSTLHTKLALLEYCNLFYTTNYDDFLERSFDLHQRRNRVVVVESHMGRRHRSTESSYAEIVKFHGDWNYPERMVMSESDYEKRLTLSTEMDYRLRADVLGRTVLFLGYSFRDPNVSYLFRLVNTQFGQLAGSGTGRRAYITVADPSDFEMQLYRARNMEVIPVSGTNPAESIVELLDGIQR